MSDSAKSADPEDDLEAEVTLATEGVAWLRTSSPTRQGDSAVLPEVLESERGLALTELVAALDARAARLEALTKTLDPAAHRPGRVMTRAEVRARLLNQPLEPEPPEPEEVPVVRDPTAPLRTPREFEHRDGELVAPVRPEPAEPPPEPRNALKQLVNVEPEIAAMQVVSGALSGLSPAERRRVLRWAVERFGG